MKELPFFPKSPAVALMVLAAIASLAGTAAASDKGTHRVMPFSSGIHPGASRRIYAHAPNVTTIDLPGSTASYALGINNRGEAVGYWYDNSFNTHGFLYSGGKVTNIDIPNTFGFAASGINDRGMIVGSYANAEITVSTDSSSIAAAMPYSITPVHGPPRPGPSTIKVTSLATIRCAMQPIARSSASSGTREHFQRSISPAPYTRSPSASMTAARLSVVGTIQPRRIRSC